MDYITIQEVAEKWGLKERRVQVMCQEEKIPGAKRFGRKSEVGKIYKEEGWC